MQDETRRRALQCAVSIAGGRKQLSLLLKVSERSLDLWLDSGGRIPPSVFFRAVDLIVEDDMARAAQDRRACVRADLPDDDMHRAAQDRRAQTGGDLPS